MRTPLSDTYVLGDLVLRRATQADAAALTSIAQTAKRHWGYPNRWLEQWAPQLTIDSATLATQTVYVAVRQGETVGFFGLLPGVPSACLDHLWVTPKHIGTGVGRRLFECAVAKARQGGARTLRIEADPHAVPFYERMGASRVGQVLAPVDGETRYLPILVLEMA